LAVGFEGKNRLGVYQGSRSGRACHLGTCSYPLECEHVEEPSPSEDEDACPSLLHEEEEAMDESK